MSHQEVCCHVPNVSSKYLLFCGGLFVTIFYYCHCYLHVLLLITGGTGYWLLLIVNCWLLIFFFSLVFFLCYLMFFYFKDPSFSRAFSAGFLPEFEKQNSYIYLIKQPMVVVKQPYDICFWSEKKVLLCFGVFFPPSFDITDPFLLSLYITDNHGNQPSSLHYYFL